MNWQPHVTLRKCTAAIAVLAMTGCVHPTRVQIDYISQRNDCRSSAEAKQAIYVQNAGTLQGDTVRDAKDRNAVLAKIFSDCMFVNGWTVATPPTQQAREDQIAAKEDDLEFLSTPSKSSAARASSYEQQPARPAAAAAPPAARKPVNAPRTAPTIVTPALTSATPTANR